MARQGTPGRGVRMSARRTSAHGILSHNDAHKVTPVGRNCVGSGLWMGDLTSINTTTAARTSQQVRRPVIASTDWSWLKAWDPTLDPFETPETDADWATIAGQFATADGGALG